MENSAKELVNSAFASAKSLLSSRKHKDLRQSIDSSQSQLESCDSAVSLVPAFLTLLDTNLPKVQQLVLNTIHELLARGLIVGTDLDTSVSPPAKLIHSIIEKTCLQSEEDTVHLYMLKVLLTAATTPSLEVHGKHLFESFRMCYHVYLISKHPVGQATAKAALTRIVHFVFSQMETMAGPAVKGSKEKIIQQLVLMLVDEAILHEKRGEVDSDPPLRVVPSIFDPDDPRYMQITKVEVTNEEDKEAGKFGWCIECRGTANFYCKETRDPICSEDCKLRHLESLNLPDPRMRNAQNAFYFDALMIFKRVCKLSLKELGKSESVLTRKSKTVSLELALAIMENPGKLFVAEPQFLYIIKSNLCESLLKNSVSTDKTIYGLSLSIFVALVTHFKDQLKAEIALFMNGILIRLLESTSSHTSQKLMIIEAFQKITGNPRTTLELFLNYDCNVEEHDIFGHMVEILRKIALSRVEDQNEYQLRLASLNTLVSIMTTQASWLDLTFSKAENEELDDSRSDSSENTSSSLGLFEKNKQLKNQLNRAVFKFNLKPMSGLQYLADTGHIDINNPVDIATFLKQTAGINKTAIGEFIGSNKPANTAVFHEFVNLFDFAGSTILSALREFLSSFRIPGEGQVVDRIMEKFAQKYCLDNPNTFASPDSAFLLSFGIMMLQTDLHNPTIKQKMPLSQFCIMFSQDPSLTASLLEEIYYEVKENPFTLQEDEEARAIQQTSGKKKHEIYAIESELLYRKSHEVFMRAKKEQTPYFVANDIEYLKTFFMSLWHPLLATFSIILEESEDSNFWSLCLKGFVACIKIACRFNMPLELEIFLSSLAKFTSLIYLHNQVSEKNIACMQALIEIARIEANFIKGSWMHVLKCLSRLDFLHYISIRGESTASEHELMSFESISGHISPSDIDSVFNLSVNLDDEAIVDFVTTLVDVSKEELWQERPQTFSLQALVNVADLNMGRMRFVWGQVWHCVKPHFVRAGLHSNQHIASFAVDSLKQLASKFLKKEELAHFNFQKEFLQPFEAIARQTKNLQVKELILACMSHFVYTMPNDLKSGWNSIFEVFTLNALHNEVLLLTPTMQAVEHIVQRHLSKIQLNLHDLLRTLKAILNCSVDTLSLTSIQLVIDARTLLVESNPEPWGEYIGVFAEGLLDKRPELQQSALHGLFTIFQETVLDPPLWNIVYSASIGRLTEYMAEEADRDWLTGTATQTLLTFVDFLTEHFDSLRFLLPTFIESLSQTVRSLKEPSAKVVIATLSQVVSKLGGQFTETEWKVFLTSLSTLMQISLPTELLETEISHNRQVSVDKCVIQLHLLDSIKKFIKLRLTTPVELIGDLEQSMLTSYNFAKTLNRNLEHRHKLQTEGFLSGISSVPGLYKQEKEGLSCLLDLYFGLVSQGVDKTEVLYETSKDFLQELIKKDGLPSPRKEELENLVSVVSTVLIPGASGDIRNAMKFIGQELLTLVLQEDMSLREQLRMLLMQTLPLMNL